MPALRFVRSVRMDLFHLGLEARSDEPIGLGIFPCQFRPRTKANTLLYFVQRSLADSIERLLDGVSISDPGIAALKSDEE